MGMMASGWSRTQVGQTVTLVDGSEATLTMKMVDEGLDAMTVRLADASKGHHLAIKGLQRLRLPAGSNGIWAPRKPVMMYKIIEAAKQCNLPVVHFDIAQKSRCVHQKTGGTWLAVRPM